MRRFSQTVRDLVTPHEHYLDAIIGDDPEAERFESLIHAANEEKDKAKYLCVFHMQSPHQDAYPVLGGNLQRPRIEAECAEASTAVAVNDSGPR